MDNFFEQEVIIFECTKLVSHVTSEKAAKEIIRIGFKTGYSLNIGEKRKAIYFADNSINNFIYARNKEGEIYEGDNVGIVDIDIKGLKFLNLTYNKGGTFVNYSKYFNYHVTGELDKLPEHVAGSISFLDDGRIYEVALKLEVANFCLRNKLA